MECNQKSVTEGNFKNKKCYKYYEKLQNIKFYKWKGHSPRKKKHKLLKLTQENIETFNRPTTNKEIELVIKILPTKISLDPDGASQVNSTKHLKQNE